MTTNVLNPKVTLAIVPSSANVENSARRILIPGQMITAGAGAGTATPGELVQDVNSKDEDALFGRRSHLAGMIRAAKKTMKNLIPQPAIDVIPLADLPAGVNGECLTSFTGNATQAGNIKVCVGSKNDHCYDVPVAVGDTAAVIMTALAAKITADLDAPFSGTVNAPTFDLEAVNAGTLSNKWGISVENIPAGITIGTGVWSGGAGDPVLTGVFDSVEDIRHTTIVWPESYAIETVKAFVDPRFNASNAIQDSVVVNIRTDTLANLKAYVQPLNSQSIVVLANKTISKTYYKAPAVFGINDNMAAEIATIRALRLTPLAPVSSFVDASGAPADAFGGIHMSSKPYHNTRLPYVPIAKPGDYFTQVEQAELTDAGISIFGANRVNNGSILGTLVTTYKNDPAGNDDSSFKYLNTVDQMSVIREFYFLNFRNNYQSARLTTGAVGGGRKLENIDTIRSYCTELYQVLAGQNVTESGQSAVTDYEASLNVQANLKTGTVTIDQKPLLVGQLRVVIGTIEVNFGA